jgi:hypothetical protein
MHMRWLGIANFDGLFSRIGMAIAAATLLLASAVHAAEMKDLTQNMPRGYFGEFRWDGDQTAQNVVITFDSVSALNGRNAEAFGCGTYEVGRQVTKIKVRMLVKLSDLQVEIFELSPEGDSPFETRGSHRGKLSKDLQKIDAQWVTSASGQRGQLHLRAASSLTCAPAAST